MVPAVILLIINATVSLTYVLTDLKDDKNEVLIISTRHMILLIGSDTQELMERERGREEEGGGGRERERERGREGGGREGERERGRERGREREREGEGGREVGKTNKYIIVCT